MIGYILAIAFGVVLVGLLVVAMSGGGGAPARQAQKRREGDPVEVSDPAADEPTPDRSATATAKEISGAKKHTPPA